MSRLTIQLMGAPVIAVDGRPIETDTRKATALVAYLAMQPGAHTRDHLATLLWPELDQTRARAALRRTLSAVNATAVAPWLDVTRESLALRRDGTTTVDALHFRTLAAPSASDVDGEPIPHLEEAAALYTGDFLTGFSLRDSTLFDDWQFFTAEELRHLFVDLLDRLGAALAQTGELDAAIVHMRRRLQLDPLHEAAHRTLMRLYVWNNQRNAALRQYRECVRMLDDELGVPPLDETTALYEEIQRNPTLPRPASPPTVDAVAPMPDSAPASSTAPSSAPTVGPDAFPLVGRDAELAALTRTLTQPGSALALIEGEAGIGKTRLVETCLAALPAPRPAVLLAQCFDGEADLAYTPIIELLRQAMALPHAPALLADFPAPWRHEVSRLAPELAGAVPLPTHDALDNAAAKSRFFEAVTQLFLLLLGNEAGGILAVDNVHWADQASRDLLAFLARRLAGEPIALLMTWRNDHAVVDAQLRQLLHAVRTQLTVLELHLARLDAEAVAALVHDVLGRDDGALAARLFTESEGNPFFLTEYLALLQRAPVRDGAPWALPGGVRDLLRSRLHTVDETGRQLLTAAAVIGRTFQFDLLHAVSGRSEEESIAALEQLLAQRLICEWDGLVYDFYHDQLRTVVYDEISAVRRRLLHRRVADALHAHARRAGHDALSQAALLAHHRAQAGQEEAARAAYLHAAQEARRVYANAAAIHHLQSALALGADDLSGIHLQLGELYTLVGDYAAARGAYETAAAHDDAVIVGGARLPLIEFRLGELHHRLGNWELAAGHFSAALEQGPTGAAGGGDAWRSQVLASWSLAVEQQGDHDRAYALAGAALDAATVSGDDLALAQAHNMSSIIARHRGRVDAALAHARQSVALTGLIHAPHARIAAHNSLALALAAAGQTDAAVDELQQAVALCAAQGDRHREAALHDHLADLHHAAGREVAAMAHLKQAVTIFAQIGAEDDRPNPEIWKLVEW